MATKNEIEIVKLLQELIQVENEKLKNSLENKMVVSFEKHNAHHELISNYSEIFNKEVLDLILEIAKEQKLKREKDQKMKDWLTKTIVGSITVTVLGILYTIGKYVLFNMSRIF